MWAEGVLMKGAEGGRGKEDRTDLQFPQQFSLILHIKIHIFAETCPQATCLPLLCQSSYRSYSHGRGCSSYHAAIRRAARAGVVHGGPQRGVLACSQRCRHRRRNSGAGLRACICEIKEAVTTAASIEPATPRTACAATCRPRPFSLMKRAWASTCL